MRSSQAEICWWIHASVACRACCSILQVRTRPVFSEVTSPLSSSTRTCLSSDGNANSNGSASSLTDFGPSHKRLMIARLVGSASAENILSKSVEYLAMTESIGCGRALVKLKLSVVANFYVATDRVWVSCRRFLCLSASCRFSRPAHASCSAIHRLRSRQRRLQQSAVGCWLTNAGQPRHRFAKVRLVDDELDCLHSFLQRRSSVAANLSGSRSSATMARMIGIRATTVTAAITCCSSMLIRSVPSARSRRCREVVDVRLAFAHTCPQLPDLSTWTEASSQ